MKHLLFATLIAGSVIAQAAPDKGPTPVAPISVVLTVSAPTVKLSTSDSWTVGVKVTNHGTATIDPGIDQSDLHVNGKSAPSWQMSLANSGKPKTFHALPAGESVETSFGLAKELFPKPGSYKLELSVSGVAAAPVTVTAK